MEPLSVLAMVLLGAKGDTAACGWPRWELGTRTLSLVLSARPAADCLLQACPWEGRVDGSADAVPPGGMPRTRGREVSFTNVFLG